MKKKVMKTIKTDKDIVGLTEKVMIMGPEKEKVIKARIDSGADVCSIDKKLADKLGLGPIERMKKIKSAHGIKERPVLRARIEIKGRVFSKVRFTVADRSHLRFKALIGKNILKRNFLIDPSIK